MLPEILGPNLLWFVVTYTFTPKDSNNENLRKLITFVSVKIYNLVKFVTLCRF